MSHSTPTQLTELFSDETQIVGCVCCRLLFVVMWPWQQPTSSAHPHYPSSSITYHHPQTPQHIVSPHTLPPSQFPVPQHYLYPPPPPAHPAGDFPFSAHLAEQVAVDTWAAESRASAAVQSDSLATLPFSSTLGPRPDVHLPPTLHPSQQATPTNVQPQQPSPLPLTPSHPPPSHTVTQSPFSMDFILREHATPTPNGAEIPPPVVQFTPTHTGPTTTDLSDPVVAVGYQSGMSEVMYVTPPPHPQMPHPHTPSPQLVSSSLSQGYSADSGRSKPVTFDPTSRTLQTTFPGEEGGVAPFSPTSADTSLDNIQPFQLHSNYRPPPSAGETRKMEIGGEGSEAPYSPPELIPEHGGGGADQSNRLNQSHDICPQPSEGGPPPMGGEEPNTIQTPLLAYNDSPLLGGGDGVTNRTKQDQNMSEQSVRPHPMTPPTPGSQGLQIDVEPSPELQRQKSEAVPPSHLPIRRSASPGDDLDIRPSAPRPPPLLRRGREGHSSDEEDDVFLPPPPAPTSPTPPPPPAPHTHSSPQPHPHSTLPSRESEADEDEEEGGKTETMATTPSKTHPQFSLII